MPDDDRLNRRLEEIAEQLETLEAEERERAAEPRSKSRPLQTLLTSLAMLLLAFLLSGGAVTLSRFSGEDIANAKRLGGATVLSCERSGPITPRGFGYFDVCQAEIKWRDGGILPIGVGNGFFSAREVGKTITVGDMGTHRSRQVLARAELPQRILLDITSYVLIAPALLAGVLGVGGMWGMVKRR